VRSLGLGLGIEGVQIDAKQTLQERRAIATGARAMNLRKMKMKMRMKMRVKRHGAQPSDAALQRDLAEPMAAIGQILRPKMLAAAAALTVIFRVPCLTATTKHRRSRSFARLNQWLCNCCSDISKTGPIGSSSSRL